MDNEPAKFWQLLRASACYRPCPLTLLLFLPPRGELVGSVSRWSCCHLPRLALLHLVHLQRLLGGEQQRREDILTPCASDFLGCCLTGLLWVAEAGGCTASLGCWSSPCHRSKGWRQVRRWWKQNGDVEQKSGEKGW